MERLTMPDKPIEGGTKRTVVDAREVRKHAMTIYWQLKKYEDTGLTPEQIREMDRLYAEKCRELVECQKKQQQDWILVSERLPEGEYRVLITDGYMVTVGWLGRDSQEWYTGLVRWSEKYQNSVLAWMPLPEPYKEEKHGSDD